MKKNYYLFAAIVIVAATVFAVVSCNKDSERQTEKNAPAYEPSEMDKAMMDFGQKLKAASNERSGETMPLAEALNTMTNYQNFSMCDASNYSLNMLADTIHATLNVVNGEVLLSELNRFYQATEPAIMSKFNSLNGDDKAIYLIKSVVAGNQRGDLDNYSGNLDVNVIAYMIETIDRGSQNPNVFGATDYWYDFNYLGKCDTYAGYCVGRDCVTELNTKMQARLGTVTCGPGYQTYFTNILTIERNSTQMPDTSSPNGQYALPWKSFWDGNQCVDPTGMNYYLNVLVNLCTYYEQLYQKPIVNFSITEVPDNKDNNWDWMAFVHFEIVDVNCVPTGGND